MGPKCKLGERGGSEYECSKSGRSGLCTKSCDWGPELFVGRSGAGLSAGSEIALSTVITEYSATE